MWLIVMMDAFGDPLYWNNSSGWEEIENAVIFTDSERTTLSLPVGADGWVPLTAGEVQTP